MKRYLFWAAALPLLVASGSKCRAEDRSSPTAVEAERSITDLGAPEADGRRTLAAFPKNVFRGVAGVVASDNLRPLLLGGGLVVSGRFLDGEGQELLRGRCASCGDVGATAGGLYVVPVVAGMFVAGRLAPQGRFRAFSYDLAEALAVDSIWNGALKLSFHRLRPDRSDRLSLPSGHTSTAFSLATVAERHYGWKVGVPAYALASYIGLARMESNRHYLSDVLAGATLGVIVGRTVTRANGMAIGAHGTLSIGPATDPHGAGLGLRVSGSF